MKRIRNVVAWICFFSGIIWGLYVSLYQMIYLSIMNACMYYDAGLLTASLVCRTLFMCAGAPIVLAGCVVVSFSIFGLIYKCDESVSKDSKI